MGTHWGDEAAELAWNSRPQPLSQPIADACGVLWATLLGDVTSTLASVGHRAGRDGEAWYFSQRGGPQLRIYVEAGWAKCFFASNFEREWPLGTTLIPNLQTKCFVGPRISGVWTADGLAARRSPVAVVIQEILELRP